jgi:hypothetical protein
VASKSRITTSCDAKTTRASRVTEQIQSRRSTPPRFRTSRQQSRCLRMSQSMGTHPRRCPYDGVSLWSEPLGCNRRHTLSLPQND